MGVIKTNENYLKRIYGYIRVSSPGDEDYRNIIVLFEKEKVTEGVLTEDMESWLYFRAEVVMFEYFYNRYKDLKKNSKKQIRSFEENYYLDKIRKKYESLYASIVKCYPEYYDKMVIGEYSPYYEDSFLFDQECMLYDFLTLNIEGGYPHNKIVFCYRYLIEGWSTKDVVYMLSRKKLDCLFIDFINSYSQQSGLPVFVVLSYFYPLEEELGKRLSEVIKDASTKENIKKILCLRTGLTRLKAYFTRIDLRVVTRMSRDQRAAIVQKIKRDRINLVDKWCERTRERIIRNTLNRLSKMNAK